MFNVETSYGYNLGKQMSAYVNVISLTIYKIICITLKSQALFTYTSERVFDELIQQKPRHQLRTVLDQQYLVEAQAR